MCDKRCVYTNNETNELKKILFTIPKKKYRIENRSMDIYKKKFNSLYSILKQTVKI